MHYSVSIKLKDILEKKGMTQKHLSELSGVRESTISDIVRGSRTVINFTHLAKIAEALEVEDIREIIDLSKE